MTNNEKETIINYNEAEAVAIVYTYNGAMKRKLAKFAAAYPELCKLTCRDNTGAVTYEVDKARLSVNFTKPLTEERRAKMVERGKKKTEALAKAREMRFIR